MAIWWGQERMDTQCACACACACACSCSGEGLRAGWGTNTTCIFSSVGQVRLEAPLPPQRWPRGWRPCLGLSLSSERATADPLASVRGAAQSQQPQPREAVRFCLRRWRAVGLPKSHCRRAQATLTTRLIPSVRGTVSLRNPPSPAMSLVSETHEATDAPAMVAG